MTSPNSARDPPPTTARIPVPDRLIALCDEVTDAYVAVALEGNRASAVVAPTDHADSLIINDCEVDAGDGRLGLTAGSDHVELELSAQTSQLGFETESGATIGVQAVSGRIRPSAGAGFDARGVSWSIGGAPEAAGLFRSLWFQLPAGGLFILFAARPVGSTDHASEAVGAAQIAPDGEVKSWTEPLLSTEYGPAGEHRRATLELWGEEGQPLDRGAGSRIVGGQAALAATKIGAARFDWKLGGIPGTGGYEILGS